MDIDNNKRHYLIDYENVHQTGFEGIEKLSSDDFVTIFYTQNANTLSFELHQALINCKAKVSIVKVDNSSKNALDFQLSSYLGFLISNTERLDIHIISNDKGFECLRTFWAERGYKIKISSDISGKVQQMLPAVIKQDMKKNDSQKPDSKFMNAVGVLKLKQDDCNKLYNIFISNSKTKDVSKRKQNISNAINKTFGGEKTKKYYKVIKPLIK